MIQSSKNLKDIIFDFTNLKFSISKHLSCIKECKSTETNTAILPTFWILAFTNKSFQYYFWSSGAYLPLLSIIKCPGLAYLIFKHGTCTSALSTGRVWMPQIQVISLLTLVNLLKLYFSISSKIQEWLSWKLSASSFSSVRVQDCLYLHFLMSLLKIQTL